MGKIIVFANTKGGVGKSMLAVHLAVWLSDRGYRAALVDADDQATATNWLARIPTHGISIASIHHADQVVASEQLQAAVGRFQSCRDFVIVDTKGAAALSTSAAIAVAQMALIPIQPSAADIWPIEKALTLVRLSQEVRRGKPEAAIILNQTCPTDVAARSIRQQAAQLAIRIAANSVPRLNAYRDGPTSGTVATRLSDKRGRKAGRHMVRLFEELLADEQTTELAANE